jgi:hypothetical protein
MVTSPENTYPRGKHGEIKIHRSSACEKNCVTRHKTASTNDAILKLDIHSIYDLDQKKYMCVFGHMSKKSRVGRSALNFFFFFNYRQNRK